MEWVRAFEVFREALMSSDESKYYMQFLLMGGPEHSLYVPADGNYDTGFRKDVLLLFLGLGGLMHAPGTVQSLQVV